MKVNLGEAGTHLWLQVEEKYPPSTDLWPLNRWLARPPSAAERESETMQCSAAEPLHFSLIAFLSKLISFHT